MARIPRAAVGDMVYHVINRSNGRLTIFKEENDYKAFERILEEAKEKYSMRILSYCIMPNHWHFIMYPKKGEDLANFIRWVTLTHTQRWHVKNKTVGEGHLYQGRYKSFPIQKDEYFLQACRYVERNPLRAKLVKKAEDWRWSSLWINVRGNNQQKKLLSNWPLEKPKDYLSWINIPQENEKEHLKKVRYSIKRNRPFGKNSWIVKTAKSLGLNSTLKPRGRPKKGT